MLMTSETKTIYEPTQCLIFYKSLDSNNYYSTDSYYTEISDIEKGEIKQSRPVNKEEMLKMHSLFKNISSEKEEYYIPYMKHNIFSFKKNPVDVNFSWHIKAHENNFINGRSAKKSKKLNYPNLFFVFNSNSLKVHSYKGVFKGNDTVLYKAPFPNIYNDNSMCFGNINVNSLKNTNINKYIDNINNSFFNTGFNVLESSNRTKSNTFELLKRLVKTKEKFPTKELVALQTKVKYEIS